MSATRAHLTWRVFLTCWLVYTAFWTPYIVREHFPALSLAEQGTLNVEKYLGWTEDIFGFPGRGAYINNNPGASLTGAIPLVVLRPALQAIDHWNGQLPPVPKPQNEDETSFSRALTERRQYLFLFVGWITVALVMAPATAGTAAYLCSRLCDAGVGSWAAVMVALLYGLGTPVFFRTAYLNHNLLLGDAGFTALLLLWDPYDRPVTPARAALAGVLAGYSVLCDYSAVVVVGIVSLYVWLRARHDNKARWRVAAAFSVGILPGVAGLVIYQAWAFGSPFWPSQVYMVPTAPTSHGYRGFDWPSLRLAWANFFDPRFGLFASCPVLLLGLAAPFVKTKRFYLAPREIRLLLTYFAVFVIFCAANQYSSLQPSTGFRYLVPVVPGLAILAALVAQKLSPMVRLVLGSATLALSVLQAAAHQNDVRRAASMIWERGFALPWMLRMADAGAPVTGVWVIGTFLGLAAALVGIWGLPIWSSRWSRRSAATT